MRARCRATRWRAAIGDAQVYNDDVIRPLNDPIAASGGTAILYGNLAPDGCVIKPPAADPRLLQHSGPAIVFDSYDEMSKAVNDPDLDVTPDHVMVLRNAGPKGGPGMPEWGMLPIPKKLLKQGVRDMLRISDARMSGTSYGACILHVAPESQVGGPLAAVRTGDTITVDVPKRSIHLHLSDEQIAERVKAHKPPPRDYPRGYYKMFAEHTRQANEGCDFDFLEGAEGHSRARNPLSAPAGGKAMQVSNADKRTVDTPALFVDLDVLEGNIARIAKACRDNGVNWRPHTKGIKVPQIARMLWMAGASGITCAKLGEAEVMAAHGLRDILIANQIVGPQKIARLVALRRTLRRRSWPSTAARMSRRSPRPRATRASPSASSSRSTSG